MSNLADKMREIIEQVSNPCVCAQQIMDDNKDLQQRMLNRAQEGYREGTLRVNKPQCVKKVASAGKRTELEKCLSNKIGINIYLTEHMLTPRTLTIHYYLPK